MEVRGVVGEEEEGLARKEISYNERERKERH